jgi:hypothetical protein
VRQARGELGPDHEFETAWGRHRFAIGDRIQFTANDHKQGISNGRAGTIAAIDGTHVTVSLDTKEPATIAFDAGNFRDFRHGYAGTIYKSQGKTLDKTYLFHSEHWWSAPSYVALTRHRAQTHLFVARNTAKNLAELARQIARPDERRAASHFYPAGPAELPLAPMTAAELNTQFAASNKPRRHNGTSNRSGNGNPAPRPFSNDNKLWVFRPATASTAAASIHSAPTPFSTCSRRKTEVPDSPQPFCSHIENAPPSTPYHAGTRKPWPHPTIPGDSPPGYAYQHNKHTTMRAGDGIAKDFIPADPGNSYEIARVADGAHTAATARPASAPDPAPISMPAIAAAEKDTPRTATIAVTLKENIAQLFRKAATLLTKPEPEAKTDDKKRSGDARGAFGDAMLIAYRIRPGFLARWARRPRAQRQGTPPPDIAVTQAPVIDLYDPNAIAATPVHSYNPLDW